MKVEPDFDNMTLIRMAIVERDERLVVLMPPDAEDDDVETFRQAYLAHGWPEDRILIMKGPDAFAVLKAGAKPDGD